MTNLINQDEVVDKDGGRETTNTHLFEHEQVEEQDYLSSRHPLVSALAAIGKSHPAQLNLLQNLNCFHHVAAYVVSRFNKIKWPE